MREFIVQHWLMHTASMIATYAVAHYVSPTIKQCTDSRTVPQDRRKTAETIDWPNDGKAGVGAEAPI